MYKVTLVNKRTGDASYVTYFYDKPLFGEVTLLFNDILPAFWTKWYTAVREETFDVSVTPAND